jgi:cytochrome c biogenesis protein CcdA
MSGVDLNLATVVLAGLVDGINPCAVAVLLVFVSATLLAVGATMEGGLAERRRALFKGGAAYVAGMFITYLLIGLGLMGFAGALRERPHRHEDLRGRRDRLESPRAARGASPRAR